MGSFRSPSRRVFIVSAASISLVLLAVSPASAVTTIDGPIDLGTATPFAVLAGSTITDTGSSIVTGDLGLDPGSAVTGLASGQPTGATEISTGVSNQAKSDLSTAYGVAASLTPTVVGVGDLTGLSLVPGVYRATTAMALTGALALVGDSSSVWVFQAGTTLTTGSGSNITITGGATACNVFWQVGTSATIGSGSNFSGTVMADQSITVVSGSTIQGRLLAKVGAVTLDHTTITTPSSCSATLGTVTATPSVATTPPPPATVGTPFVFTVSVPDSSPVTYTITAGVLPGGLVLNPLTGEITGTPTETGTFSIEITAIDGVNPPAVGVYSIVIAAVGITPAALAATGTEAPIALAVGFGLVLLGAGAMRLRRRAR